MTIVVRPLISRSKADLDLMLGLRVERRGGLVEKDDRRLAEHGAGDRETLALAARERDAAVVELGVVAVLHRHDEVVRHGVARRLLDLGVGGVLAARSGCCRECSRGRGRCPG